MAITKNNKQYHLAYLFPKTHTMWRQQQTTHRCQEQKTTKDNAAWKAQQTVSKLQKKTLALQQTVSASPKLGFRQIPVPLRSDLAEILSVSATLAMLSSLAPLSRLALPRSLELALRQRTAGFWNYPMDLFLTRRITSHTLEWSTHNPAVISS